MQVFGREVKFAMTVGASVRLAEIAPDENIEKLMDEIGKGGVTGMKTAARMLCILSESYENRQRFVDPSHVPCPLRYEEVMAMDTDMVGNLIAEALGRYEYDAKTEIETADAPNAKKNTNEA